MRDVRPAVIAFCILASSVVAGRASGQSLSITNYRVVDSQRVTLTRWSVTYSADLLNSGPALGTVTATVTSTVSNIVVVEGRDTLNFSPVPAGGRVASQNTFNILIDRTVYFDYADLHWTYQTTAAVLPVANPGPNQTAAVGATVTLNGSGSTNPSGIGTLTYSWEFTSRPPGSTAPLTNPTSVIAGFVLDVAGTYVIRLTVSNGVASDSASVTVSTTNTSPVANAGANQSVPLGSTVHLNGGGSTDVDGNPLTYAWTLITRPAGSAAALSGGSTVSPTFVVDKPGTYVAQLTVNDGFVNSTPASVTITTLNSPPVANAGSDQVVDVGSLVQLNGAGSTDVDGNPLTYLWSLVTLPAGSAAALSNTTAVNPTFTADRPGTYVAQLIVNDGSVNSVPATVTITTNPPQPPTAIAGMNQTVAHGTTVTLHGSGTDPQGLPVTLRWALITRPAGSAAVLSSTTVPNPTFVADRPGTYVAQLIVNNGYLDSAPSNVTITTTNTAPVANAGTNQTVTVGATVALDGSGSSDADHDPLTYSWTFTSRPSGSAATLAGANTAAPTFVADVAGSYVVQLIVSDGFTNSDPPATVMITAGGATITLTPNPLNLYNAPATLTVTLGTPAGPGGQIVSLASSNITVATVNPSVLIAAGFTGANVIITPGAVGSATITALAPGFTPGFATVNVATPNITVTLDAGSVGLTRTVGGHINLVAPAPPGGVVVTLSAAPSGIAELTPATVPINAGDTAGAFTAQGLAEGTATITASAPGYINGTAELNVTRLGAIRLPANVTVGPGQSAEFAVSLVTGAPTGGVTISLASSDTSKVTVTPASVFIAAGATTPVSQPQVNGINFGTANVSASAPGFTGDSQQVRVTAALSFSPDTLTIAGSATQNLTLNLSAPAPPGLTINLSSDNAAVATVPATVAFTANATIVPVPVTAVAPGSTAIRASALPYLAETSANVTVVVLGTIIVPGNVTVRVGESAALPVSLPAPAPAGGVSVSLASSDGAKATVVPSSILIPAGATTPGAQPQVNGISPGSATITTSAPGFTSATTGVTVTPGPPASITATGGTPQSAPINTAFANPLRATVKDAGGNPVGGVTVTFTAPASGPSGSFAGGVNTAVTNASGVASSATFTANGIAGSYAVTASVSGVAALASFALTNTTAVPAAITATGGTPQSAQIATAFANRLAATVKDAGSHPVSGVTVTFTAPGSGASGSFVGGANTAVTDASGVATSAIFTANTTAGTYAVIASVAGLAATASFELTNTPGPPASITATGGTPQSTPINSAFASPLQATVKDGSGNPVGGVTVTFITPDSAATATYAGGTHSATATTNPTGVATSPTLTASATVGSYVVIASVAGIPTPASFALTNMAGPPASITASGGTPQSAQINTAFAGRLQATVKDAGGNPLYGVTVTFAAPPSGAGGTFAGGVNTAVTDGAGVATSATFTANGTAGSYTVRASVAGLASTADFALTNTPGPPASITATGGTPQSAPINTAFASRLQATVKDAGGNPLNGITVTFAAPPGGASGTFAGGASTAVTDAAGVATSAIFTANGTAGSYTVSASVAGLAATASFALTNLAGPPASITATGGTPQSAQINTAFAGRLRATVKDAGGNPLSGVVVTFSAPPGGASGTFAGGVNTAVTDAAGVANSAIFTANGTAGSYTVRASVTGLASTADFALTNTPGPPASITATGGAPQSAPINTAFANRLQATVKDAGGNPLNGITVTFAAPPGGASGTFAGGVNTAVTDTAGVATSATFTANGTAGSYTVSVSVAGLATTASFALTNLAGPPASITATGGTPQSAQINTAFAGRLQATVKDAGGNPLSGVVVTFSAPPGGASGTFAGGVNTAVTDAAGVANSAIFTANWTAGAYVVSASAAGLATTASFALTNLAGPPASITATGGTPQSAQINTAFASRLQATVKDAGGNPLSGVAVIFAAPPGGASGAFAGGVNTTVSDAAGVANSAIFTANGTAGSYVVSASVAGLAATASFALTNLAGPPASITATGGTPQSAQINTAFASRLQANVKDAGGNPLSGVTVTFTAPGSGASGTFAGGANTAVTDAAGAATSQVFTANGTAGSYTVSASVAGLAATASFALTNLAGPPASITATGGTPQSAQINTAFASRLQATVKDAGGNPLSGVTVTFTTPGSGASGTFAGGVNTTATDAAGVATSATFTANGTAGSYTVSASVAGLATTASFALTNTAGPPASITATGGTPQSAPINTAFASRLQATVKDAGGNPLNGVTVTFTAPGSGASGTFAGGVNTAVTDTAGVATSQAFTANSTAGSYAVRASVVGLASTVDFSLTNAPGPPASVTATGGTPQSAPINTPFASPLQATVKDAGGNPLSGVTVTFTAPPGGASGTFAGGNTALTNAAGVATSQVFTANSVVGSYTVTASVPGVVTPAEFLLTNLPGGGLPTITVGSASVGQNLQTVVSILISQPAPAGGLPVTVTSGNPSMLLVAGRPIDVGNGSVLVTIPQDSTIIGVVLQSLAGAGTVPLTATATGYAGGTSTITLTASGFVLAGPGGLGAPNFTTSPGVNTTLSVSSARLDSAQNFVELQQIRAGFTVDVEVTSSLPAVGTVAPGVVTFSGGIDTITTQFSALSAGTTDLIAGVPSGFSVPNQNRIVNAIVTPAGLSLTQGSGTIGKDLQTEAQVILSGPAPGLTAISVSSDDPGKLLLSKTPTGAGSPSITLLVEAGFTASPIFYLQALANNGTATYRASAPGYGEKAGTVALAPSGIVIAGPFGIGTPFFPTTTGAANTPITVYSALLDPSFNYVGTQPVRGGFSVAVAVTSSNQLVGTITTSPVTIASGSENATTEFDPLNAGNTILTAEVPSGFSTPAQYRQVTAQVTTPGLAVTDGETIGQDLQIRGDVILGQLAPVGGLEVTLTSANASLLTLSSSPNVEGSGSITITIPAGGNTGSFYLQGRSSLGSVTYTASAPGYNSRTGTVFLAPSGVVLGGPIGLDLPFFFASVAAGSVPLTVYTAQLDSGNNYATVQSLRGGMSVTVSHTNTNTSVGTVTPASVTINGGSNSGALSFNPLTPGSTVITLGRPSNFGLSANKKSLMATVTQ